MSERAYNTHEKGKGGVCRDTTQEDLAKALGVKVSTLFKDGVAVLFAEKGGAK